MIGYIAVFVVGGVWGLARRHHDEHGVVNPTQVALAGFLVVNIMICVWELALLVHIKRITRRSRSLLRKLPKGSLGPLCLFEDMPLRDALSLEGWSEIWVTYSLCDTSYADANSFGCRRHERCQRFAPVCAVVPLHDKPYPGATQSSGNHWRRILANGIRHVFVFFQYCYHRRWRSMPTWGQIFALCSFQPDMDYFPCNWNVGFIELILADSDVEAWAVFM